MTDNEPLESQVNRLAEFIMHNIPGEPSQSQGAVDTAIRLLASLTRPAPAEVERVARVIANAMGDNFADAFKNKTRWVAKRGESGGRFRDINEPMQHDYIAAAQAAIAALRGQGEA